MKIRTNIKKAIILAGITTIAVSGTIFAAPDASQEKTSLDAEVVEYDMNTSSIIINTYWCKIVITGY